MAYEVERVRVHDDPARRATLFPMAGVSTGPVSPTVLCERIGLNWQAAVWLHEKGWLSFDPQAVPDLSSSQEAELRFLGILVSAGCGEPMLSIMLRDLEKPYAYRIDLMYFAWEDRTWRVMPDETEHRRRMARWIDELEESASLDSLESIRTQVEKAIREVHSWGVY
ncbi:MAG: hypothetical protein QGH42_00400 [Kiritimatiellia bacterium]|nr:hypothetical protein [Kiritimatiellia bacterium]MDP6630936.1 hypothetical protein [Kiritimatiellia bacterium]MDP6810315.1 hypothetical protein [Kiritimatiellia bacterium]MDP7022696.1 hypothetical protein [Kiritimatiellia bacterium]